MVGRQRRKNTADVIESDVDIDNDADTDMDPKNVYKEYEPNPDYLLELRTISGPKFKTLLESLKAVLNEANIVFSSEGLKLAAVDAMKIAAVHLFMDASSFEFYHCSEEKLVCGIDVDLLHKTMKSNAASDLMSFIVHKNERQWLQVSFENRQKRTTITDRIKMLNLDDYTIKSIYKYHTHPVIMCSQSFQKICREMWSIQTTLMEIDISGEQLVFISRDGTTKRTVCVGVEEEKSDNYDDYEDTEIDPNSESASGSSEIVPEEPARGIFLLKFLKSFAKAASLSPVMRLFFRKGTPLICEYSIAGLGTLQYLLCSGTGRPKPVKSQN